MADDASIASIDPDEMPVSSASSHCSLDEAERFQAIRDAEAKAINRLAWGMQHLKGAIGKKPDKYEKRETERDAVLMAMACLGIDLIVDKKTATNADEAIQDFKDTVHRLRHVRDIFQDLADDFDDEIVQLEDVMHSTVLARGIESLPDDILADILERVEEVTTENLASVCHRFRRVMFRLPTLWAHVSTIFNDSYLYRRLERSKEAGLYLRVQIGENAERDCSPQRMEALIQHSSRWKTVHLDFIDERRQIPIPQEILQRWKELSLPSICTLYLRYEDHVQIVDSSGAIDKPVAPLADWNMPGLRELTITNVVPHHASNSSLTSCSVQFNRIFPDRGARSISRAEFEQLSQFLAASPSLEFLELNFAHVDFDVTAQQHTTVELSRLKTLKLGVVVGTFFALNNDVGEGIAPVLNFANSLRTPGLSSLYLRLPSLFEPSLRAVIRSLVEPRRNYSNLHTVEISIISGGRITGILEIIFYTLPQIQHLTLSGRFEYCEVPKQWPISEHPMCALRTVSLDDLKKMDWPLLTDLISLLLEEESYLLIKPAAAFPQFEKIKIRNCPNLTINALKHSHVYGILERKTEYLEWDD